MNPPIESGSTSPWTQGILPKPVQVQTQKDPQLDGCPSFLEGRHVHVALRLKHPLVFGSPRSCLCFEVEASVVWISGFGSV